MCPPNSDDYVMEPEALHKAARTLFDVNDDVTQQFRPIIGVSVSMTSAMNPAAFTCTQRLVQLADDWHHHRIHRIKAHVEDSAQFLAVHAETMVEVDEYSATMFAELDVEKYPEATSSSADTPSVGLDGEAVAVL